MEYLLYIWNMKHVLSIEQKKFLQECIDINLLGKLSSQNFVDFTEDGDTNPHNYKSEANLIADGHYWGKEYIISALNEVLTTDIYINADKRWLNSLGHYYKLYIK